MAKEIPVEKRFWSRVEMIPFHECWEWTGHKDKNGYGILWEKRKNRKAHRISMRLNCCPVPASSLVCHTCDNPGCVRPDHLYIGTSTDNNRDTVKRKRHVNSRKTHCKYGHAFSEVNTRITPHGTRKCVACKK